jgi:sugar phosphate isomerase/epimerase
MTRIRQGFTVGLGMDVAESLRWAEESGFAFVELLLDGRLARERIAERDEVDTLAAAIADSDLDLVCHLPFALDIGSPFRPVREGSVAELLAGLDLIAEIGGEKAVFHPSARAWDLGWSDDDLAPLILDSVRELTAAAHERGVEPCAENVIDGPYSLGGFDDLLSITDAAMTFDTGHARLAGFDAEASAAFLDRHGERISHVHLSDNRGTGDEHLPVGLGTIDFGTVLAPLLDGEWSGTMTHEVGTTNRAYIGASKRELDGLIPSH